MDWHKAEEERPDEGRIILVKRYEHTRFDKNKYAVCVSGRTLYTVRFFSSERRANIPWNFIEKWTYIDED